jgi:hypothetical protein
MEYQADDYYSYKLAQGQDQLVGTDKSDDEPKKFKSIIKPRKKERRRKKLERFEKKKKKKKTSYVAITSQTKAK